MAPSPLSPVESLDGHHRLDEFDCGKPELTDWLRRFALASHRSDSAHVYVVQRDERVVGYYALATGSVARAGAPARVAKGLGNYPIPVIILARLAVDQAEQGTGLGAALLKHAVMKVMEAAEIVGVRALLVQVLDHDALGFYERFGFEPSPLDQMQMFMLLKDARRSLAP